MMTQPHSRNATATIRGYMYQFDATILAILRLIGDQPLDVEGIEDFDIGGDSPTDLFQCKYYAAQCLTPSELRNAILPMLKGFLGLEASVRERRRFHLYGYYKESSPREFQPTLQALKDALVQGKKIPHAEGKNRMEITNLQTELGITDDELECFAGKLTVHIGEEYEAHKQVVIAELGTLIGVNMVVAKEHLYPTALSLVSSLATGITLDSRRTTKAQFCSQLMPSKVLLSAWFLHERGNSAFCRDMRQRHFTVQNIDAVHRFFIVDCTRPVVVSDLLSLLYVLRRKWSSHTIRRKPDPERYAPYVYFRGLANEQLIAIKASLQNDGVNFVDGYAFAGAGFNTVHLVTPQIFPNGISLRFLNCGDDLIVALSTVTGTRCIYEFFFNAPLTLDTNVRYIAIPLNSISMIEQII